MRGTVVGLPTATPLASVLPAVFQEDDWLLRFTGAIDQLLAPVATVLDCLSAYVDPQLAPADHLPWLASWLGIDLDTSWSLEQQRAVTAAAVELHQLRGTSDGIRRQLELSTGGQVEITESGGVQWSQEPLDDQPAAQPTFQVVIRGTSLTAEAVNALVARLKPAHVRHEVVVLTADP